MDNVEEITLAEPAVTDQVDDTKNKKSEDPTTITAAATATATASDSSPSSAPPLTGAGGSAGIPQNSLATGAAAYGIPIGVPQGRLGLAPGVTITYNSQSGNGWVGTGWNIDMGSIQRNTKNGLDYSGATKDYVYTKNGSSTELIYLSGNEYRVKIEDGSFMRFFLDNNVWTVYDKAGSVYYFGQTPDSRLDDTTGTKIFKWCLDKVQDSNGNYMELSYFKDINSEYREIYLDRIDYTGNENTDLPTTNYVIFNRDATPRTDARIVYYSNFPVKTNYRLESIETYGNGQFSSRYVLNYSYSPSTDRTLLSSVVQYGSDNLTTVPEVIFTYQPRNNILGADTEIGQREDDTSYSTNGGGFKFADVDNDNYPDMVWDDQQGVIHVLRSDGNVLLADEHWGQKTTGYHSKSDGFKLADFDGDGMADFMYDLDDDIYVLLSTGSPETGFSDQTIWGTRSYGYYDKSPGFKIADLNKDGFIDLLYDSDNGIRVFLNTKNYSFDLEIPWGSRSSSVNGNSGGSQLSDMNSDGYPDFVYEDGNKCIHVLLNSGNGFATDSGAIWGCRTQGYADKSPGIRLVDINADGLPDVVYDSDTGGNFIRVLKNKGTGLMTDSQWGKRSKPYSPYSGGFQLVDMNGDGLPDFVYDDQDKGVHVLLNDGNTFATDSGPIWGTRLYSFHNSAPGYRVADINGDGLPDMLYESDTNPNLIREFENNSQYPDLMSTVDNGMGGTAEIAYTPSSAYENTLMPFILQTVSSITVNDGLGSSSTSNYTYGFGYFDLHDMEFRGFGYTKLTNPDGTTSETWYHQKDKNTDGTDAYCFDINIPDHEEYKGKPCHTEFRDENGQLLAETKITWEKIILQQGTSYPVFVRTRQKDTTMHQPNALTSTEQYFYDDDNQNGEVKKVIASGPYVDDEIITKENEFQNYGFWLWRNKKTTVKDRNLDIVRETSSEYYQNTGNLWWKEAWLDGGTNPRATYEYTAEGNPEKMWDANSNPAIDPPTSLTTYEETKTFPATLTNALGHMVRYEDYDYRYDKPKNTYDANNNKTTSDFDEFGRVTQIISYDKSTTTVVAKTVTEYHDFASPIYTKTGVLETNNPSEVYIYKYKYADGLGRSRQVTTFGEGGKEIISQIDYDEMGRPKLARGPFFDTGEIGYIANLSVSDPFPCEEVYPCIKTSYDAQGRPTAIQKTDGDYGVVTSNISYYDLSTTVIDPDNKMKTERKDYLGRVIEVTEYGENEYQVPEQYTTSYEYNAAGDLKKVKDHFNNETVMNYDTLGRKIYMQDPDMSKWQYCYDKNGNLKQQLDANKHIIKFSYDELNRILGKSYYQTSMNLPVPDPCSIPDETPMTGENPATYVYDNISIQNGIGKLYSVTNTKVTSTVTEYDAMGRAKISTKTIEGGSSYENQTEYDLSGKLKVMVYPDGYQVTNNYYPGTGLLNSVVGFDGINYVTHSVNSLYEPAGKIGQIDYPNGTHAIYNYDPRSSKLTSIVTTSPASNGDPKFDVINKEFFYSQAGDITTIRDYKKGSELQLPDNIFDYTYQYDKLHRFKDELTTNSVYSPVNYTYNAIGNIISKTVGTTTLSYTYNPAKPHAVGSITVGGNVYNFGYDPNGNMTSGYDLTNLSNTAPRTIYYNADNMPRQVVHGIYGTTEILYDAGNMRARKIGPSGTTYYIGEHFEVINGVTTKYVFAGNLRIAKIKNSDPQSPYYYHKDHLGSTSAITDVSGNIVETSNYMPFGEMRDQTGLNVSNYLFTDQEFDPETGLYYYGARYYDPVIGRFISPDSIVQSPLDPQTLNRYTYCNNNPLIYTDPSGQIFIIDDLIIAAVSYAIANAAVIAETAIVIAKGAALGSVIGGATAAVTGGNIGQGMLTGAISGALFAGAGSIIQLANVTSPLAQVGIHAAAGAASGGINSAITGGNVGTGMLVGGVSAGIGKYAGGLSDKFGYQFGARSLVGGLAGGVFSEMAGGKFSEGFAQGAKTAALGFLANECLHKAFNFKYDKMTPEEIKKDKAECEKEFEKMLEVASNGLVAVSGAGAIAIVAPAALTVAAANPATLMKAAEFVSGTAPGPPPPTPAGYSGSIFEKAWSWIKEKFE